LGKETPLIPKAIIAGTEPEAVATGSISRQKLSGFQIVLSQQAENAHSE
jgi:hypothetical protein